MQMCRFGVHIDRQTTDLIILYKLQHNTFVVIITDDASKSSYPSPCLFELHNSRKFKVECANEGHLKAECGDVFVGSNNIGVRELGPN